MTQTRAGMQNLQALRSIWITFFISPLVFVLVLQQTATTHAPTFSFDELGIYTFAFGVLFCWVTSVSLYRKKILAKIGFEKCKDLKEQEEFFVKWHIICWSLMEFVALLGFILTFFNFYKQIEIYFIFFGLSSLGFLLTRPREDVLTPGRIAELQ